MTINRVIFEYDHFLILGPTFPHEVVGFPGGDKYLFPGASGMNIIDVTHWLGSLNGVRSTIGFKHTPAREMIHAAVETVHITITLLGLVMIGNLLAGMFIVNVREA